MKLLLLAGFVCSVLVTGAGAQNVTVVYPPPQSPPPTPPQVVFIRERPVEEYAPAPVTYLIAFKNGVVRLADQYWVSGETIYYVTTDHQQMTAPLDRVDLRLSQRLNSEQNVAFSLPAEHEKTIAQAHVIRKTAIWAHKQCRCACGPPPAGGRASRASSTTK